MNFNYPPAKQHFDQRALGTFFGYARERYRIHLKRSQGEPGPWTSDPILRQYRFCNVFREADKTTAWFRRNFRDPLRGNPHVLWATVLFRWFNRIETGEILLDNTLGVVQGEFRKAQMKERILHTLPAGPWVTGSYIIKTPDGMNKLDGVLWCLEQIHPYLYKLAQYLQYWNERGENSLHAAWGELKKFPYMGGFMGYECVTDLRHTSLLDQAVDIDLWANAGPGAARGLARLSGEPLGKWNHGSERHQQEMCALMRELLAESRKPHNWPERWPRWEMREVEHLLCETDKYLRVRNGEGRPRQVFRGG